MFLGKNKDMEERVINQQMASIRKKFKDSEKIDGYTRKKCVAKILYIYILGYDSSFGSMEALRLATSKKFSEKQIGYLALSIMLNEYHEMIPLVINSFKKDLESLVEENNCLALAAISNIGAREMAESLVPIIEKMCISITSRPSVTKKCLLSLIRLYERYPDLFDAEKWLEIFDQKLLKTTDPSVLQVTAHFLNFCMKDHGKIFESLKSQIIHILEEIIEDRLPYSNYKYYNVMDPWLTIALLKYLQLCRYSSKKSEDKVLRDLLDNLLVDFERISTSKNTNSKNAFYSVFLECVRTTIHVGTPLKFVNSVADLLCRFLNENDSDIRSVALNALTDLVKVPEGMIYVKLYQANIASFLQDFDYTIRKRALGLLYEMCCEDNFKEIVGIMSNFFLYIDRYLIDNYNMKEDLVLKVIILTERFNSQYRWFFDVLLKLLVLSRDSISMSIWCRIVKFIALHADIQKYATKKLYRSAEMNRENNIIFRIAAYLLGEYGNSVVKSIPPDTQINWLVCNLENLPDDCKCIALNSLLKISIRSNSLQSVTHIFRNYSNHNNVELQQRALEYSNLSTFQHLLGKINEKIQTPLENSESDLIFKIDPPKSPENLKSPSSK